MKTLKSMQGLFSSGEEATLREQGAERKDGLLGTTKRTTIVDPLPCGSRSALSFSSPKVHLTLCHVRFAATSMIPASGTGDNSRSVNCGSTQITLRIRRMIALAWRTINLSKRDPRMGINNPSTYQFANSPK
jgi:hypothetical protein